MNAECVQCDCCHLAGRCLLFLVAVIRAGLTGHLTQSLYDSLQQGLVALKLFGLEPGKHTRPIACGKEAGYRE
jgi:hypothetical protein